MQTISSGKVQTSFGEVADIVKGGEPVTITQYGRPTMLLMRYQDGIELLRGTAGRQLLALFDERAKNLPQAAKTATLNEVNHLIDKARS